uniref:DUF148 domain-containing protein n=1 Tax=Caenorhabditis tropicalis TaxID=1561998 RepID=A0A1I7TBZ1_9PELO
MKPLVLLFLLGFIGLAVTTYMPTKDPNAWHQYIGRTPAPTNPSWYRDPNLPTKYPHGYIYTDAERRLDEREAARKLQKQKEDLEAARKAAKANEEISVAKRRNLLVGRYGFRLGKRGMEDELTEADYQELIAESEVTESPYGNFIQ